MGTHPIFESDFDCLTDLSMKHEYERGQVTCESLKNKVRKCKIDKKWTILMEESIDQNSCQKNQDYGLKKGFVWVNPDCGGTFRLVAKKFGSISCQSGAYQEAKVKCNFGTTIHIDTALVGTTTSKMCPAINI